MPKPDCDSTCDPDLCPRLVASVSRNGVRASGDEGRAGVVYVGEPGENTIQFGVHEAWR
jgi:hypothetical protein